MAASYSDIFVVPLSTGQLQFFAVDSNFIIWTCWKETSDPNSAWTPLVEFQTPNPNGVMKICGAPLPDKRVQLFAIDTDQTLWSCWVAGDGSGWTPWSTFLD